MKEYRTKGGLLVRIVGRDGPLFVSEDGARYTRWGCRCGPGTRADDLIDPVCARCAHLEHTQGLDRMRVNKERPLSEGRASISPFDPAGPTLFRVAV